MQIFTSLLPLLLSPALVFSAPLAPRAENTAKVLGDFSMLTRNVQHLSGNLASFVKSPSTGISTFSSHFSDLNYHLALTRGDTVAVGSFNTTDSKLVADAVATFAQDALTFLIALMSDVRSLELPASVKIGMLMNEQENAMAAAGQKSLVLGYLNPANVATLNLFTALENSVDENEFDTLSVAQEELQAAFANSISTYS
jgi:hypothetical protein